MGLFGKSKREREEEEAQKALDEFERRLATTSSEPPLDPIHVDGLLLKKGECAYYAAPCLLFEHRTSSQTIGGYGGASFRLMKGVRINTGSYRGQRVSETVAKQIDEGEVCITDRRLIFVGGAVDRDIAFDKIVSLAGSPTDLTIHVGNRKPMVFVTGDSDLAFAFQMVINGHIKK
jgi:hypothetical protein